MQSTAECFLEQVGSYIERGRVVILPGVISNSEEVFVSRTQEAEAEHGTDGTL